IHQGNGVSMSWIILHNPRCSKSRETLGLLQARGVAPEVVEYLKNPLDLAALRVVVRELGCRPKDLVRTKEEVFAGLGLSLEDDEAVLRALAAHPVLLERPIVRHAGRAEIGRPPERVLALFD